MLPDLLPAEEEKEANISIWAMRHKRYLKQHHKALYYNLLTRGKLNSYLHDVDVRATEMYDTLIKQLAEQENITESLKATDMLTWVQAMNNISNRVREIVYNEFVIEYCNNL